MGSKLCGTLAVAICGGVYMGIIPRATPGGGTPECVCPRASEGMMPSEAAALAAAAAAAAAAAVAAVAAAVAAAVL
jgi:hypothetical protein